MKLMHLADIHIGKRVNEFSMIENQKIILNQIKELAVSQKVEGIILAGDIYDKTIPSVEAISVFEEFVEKLVSMKIPAYIVSGNHDSVERLSLFSNLIAKNGIHIAKNYNGIIEPIIIENTAIWLLPFIRPVDVRRFYPDIEIGSYQDAVQKVVESLNIDKSLVNVLVAHQFVTANGKSPETSESETSSLGTLDSIDYSVFKSFDYVALGHIHKPQSMGRKEVRYCGSPLKYSFSEVKQNKSITIINISKKNKIKIETYELNPPRDMKELKGSIEELLNMDYCEDYMHITLTDIDVIDAKSKLENVFPNIMKLDFEEYNLTAFSSKSLEELKEKTLFEHFEQFFEKQTTQKLDGQQKEIVLELLEKNIQGGEQ